MCQHRISVFTVRTYVCGLCWKNREIETCPQGRSQNLVQLYLIGCELRPLPLPQSLFLTAWQPVVCIGLGSGVLADALIAFSMCWYLYHKRTGFARHEFIFSPFMPPNLTELRIQNRFHDYDLDELQYQFRSAHMVRS